MQQHRCIVNAAPRFLRPDYIQHNPNVPTGLNGFMDTFRARFAQPLPADYKRELLNIVAEKRSGCHLRPPDMDEPGW
jgi:predicted SnoaL-like aldol condensation-catalyzing enzyme